MKQEGSFWVTDGGNCRVVRTGGVFLSVLGPGQWDDAEWLDFLLMCDRASKLPGVPQAKSSLTVTVGAMPTTAQRKQSAEHNKGVEGQLKRIAMLTDSALVRGVLTAFGWLMPGPKLSSFSMTEEDAAFAWLSEVDSFDVEQAKRLLHEMLRSAGITPKAA